MSAPARLLVVDDNEDNRDMLARRLRKRGFEVDVAEDGRSALASLEQGSYDLVVLDVMMPDMSGLDVLSTIRRTRSRVELPVLMATAKTESQDVVDALERGANDYVTKPLDFPVVLARINAQLRTRQETPRPVDATILPSNMRAEPGTVLDGRYRVQSVLGEGAFAIVFGATQLSTGQTVAVKVLHAARADERDSVDRRRFEREMRIIGKLQHPNVIRLVDFGVLNARVRMDSAGWSADGTETGTPAAGLTRPRLMPRTLPYLVMEYLDGETLQQLVKREGALSSERAVDLMLPVISAVAAAHDHGVLHRDLKPPNIFVVRGVGGQLEPKVLDFGIAKPLDEQASVLTMNQTASVLGTPEYMAPEQLRETREPDARTDIYALGCILYEMLAGDRAFRATSYIELLQQVSTGKVTPLRERISSVPGELERIVSRAMSLDPEARYSSAEAFGNALLEWASDIGRARWSGSFVAFRDPSLPPPEPAPSAVQITANAQPVSPVMATGPGAVLSDSLPPSQVPTDSFPAVAPPSTAPPNNAHVIRLGVMLLSVGVLLLGAALLALALR
ncbi:MAG: response regulator [Sandaracinus sp.]|nr:response regulator [Sandaracinus sp.]MCB9611134.1 response regulator [Sandaracinus sp.]MCB9634175.1 response regulator [Sandaracinus sp.]